MAEILSMMLDYLMEIAVIVVLAVAGAVFAVLLTSKRIKCWVKTTVFLVAAEAVAAFIGLMSWLAHRNGNDFGAAVGGAVTVVLAAAFLIVGILGHRKKWLHTDSAL